MNNNEDEKIYSVDNIINEYSFKNTNDNNIYSYSKEPLTDKFTKENLIPSLKNENYNINNSINDNKENVIINNVEKEQPNIKKKKTNAKKIAILCFFVSLTGMIAMYFFYLYWDTDNINVVSEISLLQQTIDIEEIPNDDIKEEQSQIQEPSQDIQQPSQEFNPYWDFINTSYINVDLNSLLKTNDQTIGWIKVNNTNINYPFVQTTDNNYYLKHSFYKTNNSAGWVFLDYRNDFNKLDQNNILYAHGRLNNTMFGSLKKVVTPEWYQDTNNRYIKISSLYANTVWEVFSTYTIQPEGYYLQTNFDTKEEFREFVSNLKSRSVYNYNTIINDDDKLLTLSSCYNDSLRVVLHAKLVSQTRK